MLRGYIRKRVVIAFILTFFLLFVTSKYWLLTSPVKFDIRVFLIILILGYLFAYNLTNYVADFKSVKGKSRIDIIFLTIFFVFLFIPMSHINKDIVSKQENRTLAKWSPFISKEYAINYDFGKDFNAWFNDRFALRRYFLKLKNSIDYYVPNNYYISEKGYINKQNNWMGTVLLNSNSNYFSENDYSIVNTNINKIKDFCDKNNIKLYVIIPPIKQDLYGTYFAPIYKNPNRHSNNVDIINNIKQNTGLDIIYSYDEISNLSKTELTFFKTDHHWTDNTAYLAYLKLMDNVKKDFPNIHVVKEQELDYKYSEKVRVEPKRGYFEGITYQYFNLDDSSILDTKYKYIQHKDYKNLKTEDVKCKVSGCLMYSYKYHDNAPNLMIFGDSFTLNLFPTIVYSFNNTKSIFVWFTSDQNTDNFKLETYEDVILKNNTNVLVICLSQIEMLKYL